MGELEPRAQCKISLQGLSGLVLAAIDPWSTFQKLRRYLNIVIENVIWSYELYFFFFLQLCAVINCLVNPWMGMTFIPV